MNRRNCARVSFLRNLTCPLADVPCSWKTFFARSTPITLSLSMVAVLSRLVAVPPSFLAQRDAVEGGGNHPIPFHSAFG